MNYIALYRKYRPSKFSEVVGQDAIIKTLKNSIKTGNISHAFLFSGPRGTGKTSVAKIFAKTVNCTNTIDGERCEKCDICKAIKENDIDIIEIDAASNNGVDEIREIRNNVKLVPTIGKYKIYIIDEVHMLSIGAFNALLKTLEEPPEHVIFILATTEMHKIPLTIISRCQKFDFKKVTNIEIFELLKSISKKEKCKIEDEILELIAEISDGGVRDAINLLDQLLTNYKDQIRIDDIYALTGGVPNIFCEQLFDNIISHDIPAILKQINEVAETGKNLNQIGEKLLLLVKNVNINNNVKNYFSKEISEKLDKYTNVSNEEANFICKMLIDMLKELKKSTNQKIIFEITLLEIVETLNKDVENGVNIGVNSNPIENKIKDEELEIISREIILIRINNTLAGANKQILEENKIKLNSLAEFITNKNYNKIVNILKNGSLIASSNKYLMFEYETQAQLNLFFKNIDLIEKLMKEIIGTNYKVIGVTTEEWNSLKKEYVQNAKNGIKYKLQEEPKIEIKKDITIQSKTAIEIFGEESIDIK